MGINSFIMLDIETRIRRLSDESHMNEQQAKALLAFTSGLDSNDEFSKSMAEDVISAFRILKDADLFGEYYHLIKEIKG